MTQTFQGCVYNNIASRDESITTLLGCIIYWVCLKSRSIFSEDPDHCTGILHTCESSNAGKRSRNWGGGAVPTHPGYSTDNRSVWREVGTPLWQIHDNVQPRPYLSSKLFQHLLLKSLMIPGWESHTKMKNPLGISWKHFDSTVTQLEIALSNVLNSYIIQLKV